MALRIIENICAKGVAWQTNGIFGTFQFDTDTSLLEASNKYLNWSLLLAADDICAIVMFELLLLPRLALIDRKSKYVIEEWRNGIDIFEKNLFLDT